MKIGPKYKIAKRLGAPIFEKTLSPKFAISQARAGRNIRRGGQQSDYKKQLTEKQKMRFTYGITEKQLRRYVDQAVVTVGHKPITVLMERLESRLDNVVYRLGLTKSRQQARQVVGHGHIFVNGRRLSIPSYKVKTGDIISVREGSKSSALFVTLADTHEAVGVPAWLKLDVKTLSANVLGVPVYNPTETLFDPELVMEFYSR
jgi:small subunit ribosomal protein S4